MAALADNPPQQASDPGRRERNREGSVRPGGRRRQPHPLGYSDACRCGTEPDRPYEWGVAVTKTSHADPGQTRAPVVDTSPLAVRLAIGDYRCVRQPMSSVEAKDAGARCRATAQEGTQVPTRHAPATSNDRPGSDRLTSTDA